MFITFEGVEGSGKTTQSVLLAELLQDRGHSVLCTREPGGTDVGERIRQLLLDTGTDDMHEETELLLLFAARLQHLRQRILPALEQGKIVISDRFIDSSYAYQGAGRGVSAIRIRTLQRWVLGGFRPQLTLLLDLDPETGLCRTRRRSAERDRFEKERLSFFTNVRAAYLEMAAVEPTRFVLVDASQSEAAVQARISRIIEQRLSADGD